jgi:hypothetical protein
VELGVPSLRDLRSGGLTVHVNKVRHVTTITRVAEDLGERGDWLQDIANEMEIEDGVIRIYGVGDDAIKAFTDVLRAYSLKLSIFRIFQIKRKSAH